MQGDDSDKVALGPLQGDLDALAQLCHPRGLLRVAVQHVAAAGSPAIEGHDVRGRHQGAQQLRPAVMHHKHAALTAPVRSLHTHARSQ